MTDIKELDIQKYFRDLVKIKLGDKCNLFEAYRIADIYSGALLMLDIGTDHVVWFTNILIEEHNKSPKIAELLFMLILNIPGYYDSFPKIVQTLILHHPESSLRIMIQLLGKFKVTKLCSIYLMISRTYGVNISGVNPVAWGNYVVSVLHDHPHKHQMIPLTELDVNHILRSCNAIHQNRRLNMTITGQVSIYLRMLHTYSYTRKDPCLLYFAMITHVFEISNKLLEIRRELVTVYNSEFYAHYKKRLSEVDAATYSIFIGMPLVENSLDCQLC